MYAIFETGGKQYKVAAGDVVRVEKLPDAEGAAVKFDKVLAVSDGKETLIGTPYLDAATVDATVTAVGKGEKVIVFKFKAKKGYRRKQGHRQPFTEIEIESVSVGGKTVLKKEAPKKAEKPAPKESGAKGDEAAAEEEKAAKKPADKTSGKTEKADKADKTEDKAEAKGKKAAEKADKAEAEVKKADEKKPAVSDEKKDAKPAAEVEAKTGDKAAADEKNPEAKESGTAKLTKADIIAKLDALGASYAKSAKKDELLAILAEAEKK
jgi:large subunit ribosomal protein L21